MEHPQPYFIAIAKDSLRVHTLEQAFAIPNTKPGFRQLLKHLRLFQDPRVVCEATGGYERQLVDFLYQHKIPLALINPRLLRAFAKSEGLKAKTDPLDAAMILNFAKSKHLRPSAPPRPEERALADLLDRRNHLSASRAREKIALKNALPSPSPLPSIASLPAWKRRSLGSNWPSQKIVDSPPALSGPAKIISSVKGVGNLTAWSLLAYLKEIAPLNRNQVVALAGLAPFNWESGSTSGRRFIQGGRTKIRRVLFMAAPSASSNNPVIKPYVESLLARGKPYKCALVAAMRKLLIHIHSLLKSHSSSLAS
jgi:transposase